MTGEHRNWNALIERTKEYRHRLEQGKFQLEIGKYFSVREHWSTVFRGPVELPSLGKFRACNYTALSSMLPVCFPNN